MGRAALWTFSPHSLHFKVANTNSPNRAQLDTPTNDGRAKLPVCPNLTASQRSDAGGTLGGRTPENRSARSRGRLCRAAAPPYLGGGVKLRPITHCQISCRAAPVRNMMFSCSEQAFS